MHFPKHVYKVGTGKKVDESGFCTAESKLVRSAEELAKLEGEWVDNPADAVTDKSDKKPSTFADLTDPLVEVKPKKGK